MPVRKWTKQQREKFKATMAAKRTQKNGHTKRSEPVSTFFELRGGRMRRVRVREVFALITRS